MDSIKDFDDDGFELSFEDGTSTEERKFYVQTFTNVNMVADQKNHCTCCNTHIGTAPSAEKIVCMHPVLRVTQCVKCYRFYNSGEFDKGEDGSELYCRWCGQGGDVYCCSDCPYVFCKKCILQNLSKNALNEVTSNDNWKCYSCAPAILYPLRARHWALTNFIQKQKKKIDQMVKRGNCDQDVIADAMIRDVTVCCRNKSKSSTSQKRKRYASASESEDQSDESSTSSQRNRKTKISRKTVESSNSDAESVDSEISKAKGKRPQKTKPIDLMPKKVQPKVNVMAKSTNNAKIPTAVVLPSSFESSLVESSSECNDVPNLPSTDIDSTPDLFAYLVNHGIEQTFGSNMTVTPEQPSSSTHTSSPPSTSSPLVIHGVAGSQPKPISAQQKRSAPIVRRPVPQTPQSTTISGNSVFHNYNGYRIDLQNAAKQSTVRLPNGKIIHVKKHTPLSRSDPPSTITRTPTQTVRVPAPQSIRPQIVQPVRAPVPRRGRPIGPGPQHIAQPQRPYIRTSISQAPSQPPYTIQNSGPNNMYALPFQASTGQIYPNQMQINPNQMQMNNVNIPQSNQNPVLSAPRTYTNDKIGRARTQLEQQIFNAISICHQIDGKLKTLMNSNAYKNVTKLNDIKELYIHLSYLFTYTNGRFKTVQEKCMDDMRRLGFKSFANSLSSGNVIDKYGSDADEDELEIVEPSHQTISLDSDDEQSTPPHKKSTETSKTVLNEMSVANQPPVQPNSDTQLPAQPSSLNISNPSVEEEATTLLENNTSTEHLECDVDIMALLQPQIMFDEDENIDSLLTRMDDEIEIGTPPLSEETDTGINKINDLKLRSEVTVRLNRAETEFPEIFKKLKETDAANEIENDQQIEADSSDDVMLIGETASNDRPASKLGKHTEEISSSVNEYNVDVGEKSKEADNSAEEENQVAGDQINSNIDGEISKESDNSTEEENQVAGDQIDSSNEMISKIEEQSATATIEISAQNEQDMEGKSSITESSKELEVPVDENDENSTKDDAHTSVEITTTEKIAVSKAQSSDAQSNEEITKENDMEIIEKANEERTAEKIQQNDVETTAPISENEVNEENVYRNDTDESSKFVDASNDDFDDISSPDTFAEMAQNERSDNSPHTDNLEFADALDTHN